MNTSTALVVSNESPCSMVLGSLLKAEGYSVVTSSIGDGFQHALDLVPDLIIIESEPSQAMAVRLVRILRMRRETRAAAILLLTSDKSEREIDELLAAGFDGALIKPIGLSSIGSVLAEVRDGRNPGSCRSIRVLGWDDATELDVTDGDVPTEPRIRSIRAAI